MKSTRAEGRISTSCNFDQNIPKTKLKVSHVMPSYIIRAYFTCIRKCNGVPCNRWSSKLDDPVHQVKHQHRKQREEPASLNFLLKQRTSYYECSDALESTCKSSIAISSILFPCQAKKSKMIAFLTIHYAVKKQNANSCTPVSLTYPHS